MQVGSRKEINDDIYQQLASLCELQFILIFALKISLRPKLIIFPTNNCWI